MTITRTFPPTSALDAALDLVDALEAAATAAKALDVATLEDDYAAALDAATDAAETLVDAVYGGGLADALTCQDARTADLAHRAAVTLGRLGRQVL